MTLDGFFVVVGWWYKGVILANYALDLEIDVMDLTGLIGGLMSTKCCVQGPLDRCGA